MKERENLIVNLSTEFALEIINFCELLRKNNHFELASQVFRSGTSIGANVREAQSPESRSDFIHKMKIADKEAREVQYWLELCDRSEQLPSAGNLSSQIVSIRKVLNKILGSSRR